MAAPGPHKPTILQIIPELGAGGAEQGAVDMAIALVQNGARSMIASHGGHRVQEIIRAGAEHIELPVHSKNPLVIYKNTNRLISLIKKEKIDIVHVRSRAPAWSAWKACQRTKTKFMTTCHAPYNHDSDLKKRYNSIMSRGERVIAISHFVADYLRKNFNISDENLRIIPRGISIEKFHPKMVLPQRMIELSELWRIPEDARIILMPGRITRWKGHHVLIDAMAKIQQDDLFCIMIGADQGRKEYRQELEHSIDAKGLAGHVRLVEHCNDIQAAYMMSEVVVSASIEPEGFGRVPVEAQAMGCPIIATNHGGAMETVFDGETGLLIPPGDADALAHALLQILNMNSHDRAIMATKGMANAAHNFSREMMVERTLDVYAELLDQIYAEQKQAKKA